MTVVIPPLTDQILRDLGEELGGCDFTDRNARAFLSATSSCDVQAAPGHGKTTLLVAKLALVARTWNMPRRGVCVVSHTNAARDEVEKKLATHPSAAAFLAYPHFIGTVTAFIDRFIALPYLRGLGWSLQRIDDDTFGAIARSRWHSHPELVRYSRGNNGRNARRLDDFASRLELSNDFSCRSDAPPQSLPIRARDGQPGSTSQTGAALARLKAELTNDGYFRFDDMIALAARALAVSPAIIERIRARFPLVLLDEAQDTNSEQLALLNRLFADQVAYQRLGDRNQTLYERDDLAPHHYWQPRADCIPLNRTRRFGPEIAAFASRLTVRTPQQIEGQPGASSRRTLILFDRDSISRVIPAFAAGIREHWRELPHTLNSLDVRVVASRHNPSRDTSGGWPKTLVDYCPGYRSGVAGARRPDTLCAYLRNASTLHQESASPAGIAELADAGLVALLRRLQTTLPAGQAVTRRNLRTALDGSPDAALHARVRRLIRDHVLLGKATLTQSDWDQFRRELKRLLGIRDGVPQDVTDFLEFSDDGMGQQGSVAQKPCNRFVCDGILLTLGSIHSVKGRSVDALLAVETEVYRGRSLNMRAMDLTTVLPHAFGLENRDFSTNPAELAAVTNIFVAATRPRKALACALRKEAASVDLLDAARVQGWDLMEA